MLRAVPELQIADSDDPCTTRWKSRTLAAGLSLRSRAVGAGLRQRRNARCDRMEAGLPLGARGVQSEPSRFSGRPRKTLPAEARARSRERAFLPDLTRRNYS